MKRVTTNEAVNFFISLSNETGNLLSNLKLQKLLYYLQSWHLAKFEKKLFTGDFQAWVHGPVLPAVYQDFKHFKWNPIDKDVENGYYKTFLNELTEEQCEIIKDVVRQYFGESAYELELMTHREDPWIKARKGLSNDEPSENLIETQWMIDYYKQFLINA